MEHDSQPKVYCVHVWIREIHPMLWRRFPVRSDSTLANLHVVLQIGFDWTDFHLHRFRIRKKDYAVPRLDGLGRHDARKINLADLHFRANERFLYELRFLRSLATLGADRETVGSRDQPVLSGVCGRSMGWATGGLRGTTSVSGSTRVSAVASQRAA